MPDWPAASPNANLALISASACAVVLLLSAVGHLRAGTMRYELAAHGVVPVRLRPLVSAAVVTAEGFLAVATVGALIAGGPALRWVLGLSAVLFGCYLGYVLAVLRTAPQDRTGCGCGVGEHPIGIWTAVKAAGLTGLAAAGALGGGSPLRTDGVLVSAFVSIAVVCLVVWLPVSLSRPGQLIAEQIR